jgi:hypothetical protein
MATFDWPIVRREWLAEVELALSARKTFEPSVA